MDDDMATDEEVTRALTDAIRQRLHIIGGEVTIDTMPDALAELVVLEHWFARATTYVALKQIHERAEVLLHQVALHRLPAVQTDPPVERLVS